MQENYYSQIGQDRFIDEFYNKKEFMRTLLANCAEAFPYLNYLQS